MWIIKSLITNPGSYDPIIVMGTFTNYYYVMILDGDNESFLENAEFYTPEENIKYKGHVKATKIISTYELLIFTRIG